MKNLAAWRKYTKSNNSAVTTVIQCRVPIFSPRKQPSTKYPGETIIENPWGTIRLRNSRLTQIHRNILDCVFTYYFKRYNHKDGCVTYLISLRQLQKRLGVTATNHQWIVNKLDELRETTMIIQSKNKEWGIHSGIIRKHQYTKIKNEQLPANFVGNLYRKEGNPEHNTLYGITFESEYMQLFKEDLNVHSQKLTAEIINLNNPLLQALVRLCISHRLFNSTISSLLVNLGATKGKRQRQRQIKIIKDNALRLKSIFGIEITENHIFYEQHCDIWFGNACDTV